MYNNKLHLTNLIISLSIIFVVSCACTFKFNEGTGGSNSSVLDSSNSNTVSFTNNKSVENKNISATNKPSKSESENEPSPATNRVCDNPKKPCSGNDDKAFEDYELSFQLPTKMGNKVYKSEEFYAIIIDEPSDQDDPCVDDPDGIREGLEQLRKDMQKGNPTRKIFVNQECAGLGFVEYVVNGKPLRKPFLAVFGGRTQNDVDDFFADGGKRDATKIVKMTVQYDNTSMKQ